MDKSVPRVCQTVTLGTDFSIRTSHSCQILILYKRTSFFFFYSKATPAKLTGVRKVRIFMKTTYVCVPVHTC